MYVCVCVFVCESEEWLKVGGVFIKEVPFTKY